MLRSGWHTRSLVLGIFLYALGGLVSHGSAQVPTAITSDGTLGTTITQSGNLHNINGGTIKGTNQFHSFRQFSVGTGDVASFNGPTTIENILSRVTGGTRSDIDGTVRSTIPGANLFLLNPSGILFGPNANLDVSGSFHATTADYIRLTDGVRFDAVPSSADSLLTTAPPAAFGFLTSSPAPIDVQAGTFDFDVFAFTNVLQVPAGKTLSFVGGPINIGAAPDARAGGFVLAPGGRVNLVSVASPGEASFDGTGFNVDSVARLGDISIKGNANVDGKEVFIRAGRLTIEGGTIFPGLFFLAGVPVDPPNGGEVNIQVSDSVNITGPPSEFTGNFAGVKTIAGAPSFLAPGPPIPGDVPHITIKASSLSISELGRVETERQGPGNPSNVSIEANTVEVRSGGSIGVLNRFEGPGGTLTISARDVTLDSAGSDPFTFTGLSAQADFHPLYAQPDFVTGSFATAFLPSLQLADSGSITVNAPGTLTMRGNAQISADSFAFGKSSGITINAGDMLLVGAGTNTGVIAAQSRLAGQSGSVTINATGSIDMQNGFRISANTLGSGDGGQVNVRAGRSITMSGGSTFISSVTDQPLDVELDGFAALFFSFFLATQGIEVLDYSSLRAALGVAPGVGDLMNVLAALRAISDEVGNPLVAVTNFNPGAGGKISLTAPVFALNDGAHVETSTLWDGNAGEIEVNVDSLTLRDGSIIGSRSGALRIDRGFTVGKGNAGTVNIAATDTIEVSGRSPTSGESSTVTTSTSGDGNGGDVSLSAGTSVSIVNGGLVSADSLGGADVPGGAGLAGNISITAGEQIVMTGGSVSTRAVTADGGNITLTTTGSLVDLTNSQITTSVESGVGTGGNIAVNSNLITLTDSQILANAFGGPGGNINIIADVFLVNQGGAVPPSLAGIVDASSALSTSGTINIQANVTDISQVLAQLPADTLQAATLLQASCAARLAGGKASSLVFAGREGVPPEPTGLLWSPVLAEGLPDARTSWNQKDHREIVPRLSAALLDAKCMR
jgi:filamentous hemagglutinin family protein